MHIYFLLASVLYPNNSQVPYTFIYLFIYALKVFSVLFFVMLLTLGVGSAVSLTGCVVTIICDDFPHWKRWIVVSVVSLVGFLTGLVYVTPVSLS